MNYAYFPGCVALDSCRELDAATRALASGLGIELVDLSEAACCGAGYVQEHNHDAALALNARTFAMAEALGLDILTICGTCQLYLSRANEELKDPETRERINKLLERIGKRYDGGVRVKHLLQVLLQDIGPRKLAAHVRRPLHPISVGAYYGCHLLRAPGTEVFEDPEDPGTIEKLVEILGAKPIRYEGRTQCCGFHALTVRPDLAVRMSGAELRDAKQSGAACLATPCPLCHIVLDTYQRRSENEVGEKFGLPILHLSQLVGLALGIDPRTLGLNRHMVSTASLMDMLEAEECVRV